MKKETIERIISNSYQRRVTVIGRYTYRFDVNTGELLRCSTDDLYRSWGASDGDRYVAWVRVKIR